ncbi:HlyD family efflux transporter periplasmic adaptor subunit [Dysgonomonas sp. 216]|uniref:HlyD family secretion protein n=1 Tax=Dysgonomonas sp. 216 TaxID=2302934 RepID=UPI0013D71F45|nr:HlyD family efflux transporter periplasmic adaptor subunit [Dysgonomonas sp. 216]NDW18253.1 HlyD family efflux transporter periplasmic adaptor subunit [Dysgonomonas sp. 216]
MKISNLLFIAIGIIIVSACGSNDDFDASGVFETTEVIVSARGSGELVQFNVQEGQLVDSTSYIGVIDTVQLHLKKLQLIASASGVSNKQTSIPKQIAALQQQIATQKQEQKRFENLVKANAANQKQLDDINEQIKLLEKQLAAQLETLSNTNSSIKDENLSLNMQIAQIEDQIEKSIITSPIKGTVLAKYAERGELATQGRALFKVADIERMYLRAYITASQLTMLNMGQQVKVYADMGEKDRREYQGTVTWISDKAEFTPKTIQTRDERANLVYAVKIAVKNDGYIKRGMYGEIRF